MLKPDKDMTGNFSFIVLKLIQMMTCDKKDEFTCVLSKFFLVSLGMRLGRLVRILKKYA